MFQNEEKKIVTVDQYSGVQSLKVRSNDDVTMYCEFGEISTPIIFPSCP